MLKRLLVTLLFAFFIFSTGSAVAQSPTEPPNNQSSFEIFEVRCSVCHGPMGQGNGESAGDLQSPPPDFTSELWRRTAVPTDLFLAVSTGNIPAGMPPFGEASSNPISENDRWNLISSVYSMGVSAETIESGQAVFELTCAECHGEDGAAVPEADLTTLDYWFSRSNQMVFEAMSQTAVHEYTTSETENWNVIEFARTFSYQFGELFAPPEPIETAVIAGTLFNGTTSEPVREGSVNLRAFTLDLQEQLSLTTEVDADGRYQFDLSLVPPDWVYLVSADYSNVTFNSVPSQLSNDAPSAEMPIVVYDQTSDSSAITIPQIHIILSFGVGVVRVNELYFLENSGTAVFVGDSTTSDETLEIDLPAGAQNVNFRRSFGNVDSFAPAPEIIMTDDGWADTIPFQPGGFSLLVSYELPYESGLTIAHPLAYPAGTITAILPDVGATLDWVSDGIEQLSSGQFLSYTHDSIAVGEALVMELNGRPQLVTDQLGNTIQQRDTNTELIIGITLLAVALMGASLSIYRWRAADPLPAEKDGLLQALAELDNAFEAHEINGRQYQKQRQKLKIQLQKIWE